VCRYHPVLELWATDKTPAKTEDVWGFYRSPQDPNAYQSFAAHVLPAFAWEAIAQPADATFPGWKFLPTEPAARTALARALARLAGA
jgi:hypothetical protein